MIRCFLLFPRRFFDFGFLFSMPLERSRHGQQSLRKQRKHKIYGGVVLPPICFLRRMDCNRKGIGLRMRERR